MPDLWFNVHPSTYFQVYINNLLVAAFTECTLPNLQVKTESIVEGGQNTYIHQLPINVDVGTVTLKRGLTRTGELLRWYLQVVNGNIPDATRQVTIIMLDEMSLPLATFSFRNAFPTKWRGPSLKSDTSAIAIDEIELVHHGFEVAF